MNTSADARRLLAGAFREITWGLMGLFELHDLEPEVAADAGEMLARIYRARVHSTPPVPPPDGIKRLLKQLDHDQAADKAA
jgi:hypothetical protein